MAFWIHSEAVPARRWPAGGWPCDVVYAIPSMMAFRVALGRMAWAVFTWSGW